MTPTIHKRFLWLPAQVLDDTLTSRCRWLSFVWYVQYGTRHTPYVTTERVAKAYAVHVRARLRREAALDSATVHK